MENLNPTVSLIVPMRNEEDSIQSCLDSIIGGDYPHELLQILIADGMSEDLSRDLVENYIGAYPFIHLLDNPKQTQAAGFNRGLAIATGEIVLRIDAHTIYSADYIKQCVDALASSGAANVGGVQQAFGESYIASTIAIATTTKFGMGNAYHRYGNQAKWVDTVYLGAWRRSTLELLGGLNEDWVVNEDYEMNHRLRSIGGGIWLSPNIRCWYSVRKSFLGLAKQYFRYGLWKVKTLKAHPASLRWRQVVPPIFVMVTAISIGLLTTWWPAVATVGGFYALVNLSASLFTASSRGLHYFIALIFAYTLIHLSWGLGFWAGMFRFGVPLTALLSLRRGLDFPTGRR